MARADTGFAAAALIQVNLEGVLLTGRGCGSREQMVIASAVDFVGVVRAREVFDSRELALLGKQSINQRPRGRFSFILTAGN